MKAVNLLPADQRTRSLRVKPTRKGLVGICLVALVAGVGYWGFATHQEVGDLDTRLAEARTEQSELQAQVGAFSAIQQHRAVQERKKGLVVGLTNARINWERIIRDTATVMPRQVWLTGLKADSPGLSTSPVPVPTTQPAAPSGAQNGTTTQSAPAPVPVSTTGQPPNGLHLTGYAYNHRQVAIMMVRVGAVAGLGEPKLTNSTVEARGGRKVVQFQIDVPIDQRAQDRPTLSATGSAVPTSTPVQP